MKCATAAVETSSRAIAGLKVQRQASSDSSAVSPAAIRAAKARPNSSPAAPRSSGSACRAFHSGQFPGPAIQTAQASASGSGPGVDRALGVPAAAAGGDAADGPDIGRHIGGPP